MLFGCLGLAGIKLAYCGSVSLRQVRVVSIGTDIADYLGLTIETVSRTMTKLRAAGLIDIEQYIIITIKDHEALVDVADGGTL